MNYWVLVPKVGWKFLETILDVMNIEKLANKNMLVDVFVDHLDNKHVHCTKKQSRKSNLEKVRLFWISMIQKKMMGKHTLILRMRVKGH